MRYLLYAEHLMYIERETSSKRAVWMHLFIPSFLPSTSVFWVPTMCQTPWHTLGIGGVVLGWVPSVGDAETKILGQGVSQECSFPRKTSRY